MSALLGAGCGGEAADPASSPAGGGAGEGVTADTPAAAIQGMLALAKADKWTAYVATYYGEQHKMDRPDEQIAKVAARLEKAGPQLIEMLTGCVGQMPALSEDGTVATWPNQFMLHKTAGQWGFHL